MNDEQEKKTFEKYLPDFSSRAVNMEDASKQLKEALAKIESLTARVSALEGN